MRRALSKLLFKLARGSQQFSLFLGGISALGMVVAVVMFIFNQRHGAAHYGDFTVRRWLWEFPAVAVGAWLIGFRWIPWLLGFIGMRLLSQEDRLLLSAAVEVSRSTSEPIPSLDELRAERAEFDGPRRH
jgi:hypothetical protein